MKQLLCGAAIRDITPPEEILHGLRGLMGCPYGGVHDPLKVRAIAFSNGEERALIIQPDTDKDQRPLEVLKTVEERWGIPEENILYFGIHTHTAPMFTGRGEQGRDGADPEVIRCTKIYEELFMNMLYEAVEEALGNMRPCRIGCGSVQDYTNVRRVQDFTYYDENGLPYKTVSTQGSDGGANVSHDMFVMRVNDLDDKPIAFLINFPMHCVAMFLNKLAPDGTNLISGDVAGNVSRAVENRFPGAVAVWSSGAAGDMNPFPNSFNNYIDPETNEMREMLLNTRADDILDYFVGTQFMSVMGAINNIKYYTDRAEISGGVEWSKTPLYKMEPVDDTPPPPGRRPRMRVNKNELADKTFDIRLQKLRIGDVMLLGVGGELFNSFAEELKAMSPVKHTAVINHNLSLISLVGYILDDDAIARNYGLHGGGSPIVPGCISDSLKGCFKRLLEA